MLPPLSKSRTILLIDDDEDDCFLFRRAFQELNPNLDIRCTHSADHLIKVLENTNPALIFIDLHLPKQNGFACLNLIRSHVAFQNVPVIFWSGSCDFDNLQSAYNGGAQYYFEKPFSIGDLVVELKKILSHYSVPVNSVHEVHAAGLSNCYFINS